MQKNVLIQKFELPFNGLVSSILIDFNGYFNYVNNFKLSLMPNNSTSDMDLSSPIYELFGKMVDNRFVEVPLNYENIDSFNGGLLISRAPKPYLMVEFITSLPHHIIDGIMTTNNDLPEGNINIGFKTCNYLMSLHNETVLKYHCLFNSENVVNNYPLTKVSENVFIEGYWYENTFINQKYPSPLSSTIPVDEIFINKLKTLIKTTQFIDWLGPSMCRLCNKSVGNKEYESVRNNITFRFPEGIVHYYIEHNVKPSNEFYDFVMTIN